MANGQDWSRIEVEACVADYLHMLTLELNGQSYNKTRHAEALMPRLQGRNRSSIEYKHRNISAVMIELGYPSINGYKPLPNLQALLFDVVEAQVGSSTDLQRAAEFAVLRPAVETIISDHVGVWVAAPQASGVGETRASYAPRFSPSARDYLAQEARNRSLGRAGELFVAELEARRLHAAGKSALSERVEHVAATKGDGLGYDVLSFEENGRERLIEVKTTAFGELTPFFVSRNELARSEADAAQYQLYRVFNFRARPRLFNLPGVIAHHCQLDPVSYLARIGG